MTSFEQTYAANKLHAEASRLTVALLHIAKSIERGEECTVRYANAVKLYAEIGRGLANLADVVQPQREDAA